MNIEKVRCLAPDCGYMINLDKAIAEYGPTGPSACPRCGFAHKSGAGWPSTGVVVRGRTSKTKICDATCLRARGGDCLCSCGGANHGAKT